MIVEFMQTIERNAVNRFTIYGVIDAISVQIGADLYFMLIVHRCAVCQTNIRKVGEVRHCIKFLDTVIVDQLLCGFEIAVLGSMRFGALYRFSQCVPIEHIIVWIRRGKFCAFCRRIALEHIALRRRVPLEHIFLRLFGKELRYIGKADAVHIVRGILSISMQHHNIRNRQAVTGEVGRTVDIELIINVVQCGIRGERCGIFQLVVAAVYRHAARMNPVVRSKQQFCIGWISRKLVDLIAVAVRFFRRVRLEHILRRNRHSFSGVERSFDLSDTVKDFGVLPACHLSIILNNGVLAVYALHKIQTARKIFGIHCSQRFSLVVREFMVSVQSIFKRMKLLDVQSAAFLNILCNIEMGNELLRLCRLSTPRVRLEHIRLCSSRSIAECPQAVCTEFSFVSVYSIFCFVVDGTHSIDMALGAVTFGGGNRYIMLVAQLLHIPLQAVRRDAAHLYTTSTGKFARGKVQFQQSRSLFCILTKHFKEIAYLKQYDTVCVRRIQFNGIIVVQCVNRRLLLLCVRL